MTAPVLLKLKAAATAYGVSYDVLYDAVKSGDLEAIRPYSAFLVTPDDVMAFLRLKHQERMDAEATR